MEFILKSEITLKNVFKNLYLTNNFIKQLIFFIALKKISFKQNHV